MFEQQISQLRRSLGRDDAQQRSRWLAPLAIGVAGITGVFALVASRLRRPPAADSTSKRARTTSPGTKSAQRESPATEGRAEPAKPRTRRVAKGSSSDGTSSRRGTPATRTRKKTSASAAKRATTGTSTAT